MVGGQVIGKSDRLGAHPISRSFDPPDLAATIYHALGVDPGDRAARPARPPTAALLRRADHAAVHGGLGLISGIRFSAPPRQIVPGVRASPAFAGLSLRTLAF